MLRQVSASLLNCKKMDAVDMAVRFKFEYLEDPYRGYGMNVTDIFRQWKTMGADMNEGNVHQPSDQQFRGTGSYGNGGAMRVAPVALFATTTDQCIKVCSQWAL